MKILAKSVRSKPVILLAVLALSLSACSSASDNPLADAISAYEKNEFSVARIHALSALKENSSDAKANLVFGKILLEMGDGEGAIPAFKKIMNNDKYGAESKPLLAHALLLSGATKKALELSNDPGNSAKLHWVKASALLGLDKPAEALEVIENGLTKQPKDVPLLILKAKYHLATGKMELAMSNAALALQNDPDSFEALEFSGRLAMLDQNIDVARSLLTKASKKYPESVSPIFSLAAIHADLGEEKKAREYFDRILKMAPNHPLALFMLAELEYDKGDVVKAHSLLQNAGEAVADVPQAILLSAKIANKRGNHEIAIAHAQKYLRIIPVQIDGPDRVDGIVELGRALQGAGNSAQAYQLIKPAALRATASPELLQLAAKLAKNQGDALAEKFAARSTKPTKGPIAKLMKKADVAIKRGDWKGAGAVYAGLRASGHKNNPVVLNNSALVALERGDMDEAIKHARAAFVLAPDDAFVLDTLGWIMLKKGDENAKALALIEKAAKRAPGNAEILGHLAKALSANGNAAAAAQINKRLPATS